MEFNNYILFFIAIVGLIYTILHYILLKRKSFPSIQVNAYRLPPYSNKNEETLIIIKNVGTSTAYKISASVNFSYPEEKIDLDIGKHYFLAVNESLKNYLKLPEPSSMDRFYIEIVVKFHNNKLGSETTYTEKIYSDEHLITQKLIKLN